MVFSWEKIEKKMAEVRETPTSKKVTSKSAENTRADNQRRYIAKARLNRHKDPLGYIRKVWGTRQARMRKKTPVGRVVAFKDLTWPTHCPILGCKLDYTGKGLQGHTWSIDRKDPSKGYTKENTWVISHLANRMKNNATPAELVKFAEWVLDSY